MKKLLLLFIIFTIPFNLFSSNPLVAFKDGINWIILAENGDTLLTKTNLKSIESFSDSVFCITIENDNKTQWGIMDMNGKITIIPEADGIEKFSDGIAVVFKDTPQEKIDRKYGFINRSGEFLSDGYTYFDVISFREGLAYVWNNKERGYINIYGQMTIPLKDGIVGYIFSNGIAAVSNSKLKVGFIDNKGNQVLDFIYNEPGQYSEGMLKATFNGQVGYVDLKGNVLIKHEYYGGKKFNENRVFLAVQGPGLRYMWALANKKGEMYTAHKYYMARKMSEGLAAVKTDTYWEYIDKEGQVVLKNRYRFADSFINNLAWVSRTLENDIGYGGYINKEGKFIYHIKNLEFVFDLRTNRRVF